MEDIVPGLLEAIQKEFSEAVAGSKTLQSIAEKVADGTATYAEANTYAIEAGDILTNAYLNNLSSGVLPDGKMYYNIASRILPPTMSDEYDLVADVTEAIQQSLNEAVGIGIKAIRPKMNSDTIDRLVNELSNAASIDDEISNLKDTVGRFSQEIVDRSVKENAEFQGKSGMSPKIIRRVRGGCCKWCISLAGTYRYPDVPNDVYRRHNNCRCTVEYDPGSGKVQNVHSKQWRTAEESAKIEERKKVGFQRTGGMTSKEYAEYQKELREVGKRNYKQIVLPKDEYANIMSQLNTFMSDEDRKHALVIKPIGNYYYTVINHGFDDYIIVGKRPINTDAFDEF
jgi:hypothetical protein